jgi:hypothetical protein
MNDMNDMNDANHGCKTLECGLTEEQVSKAVEFWKEQLRSGIWDNGDSSATGFMTTMMARDLQESSRPQEDVLEKFGVALDRLIREGEIWSLRYGLSVDYEPGGVLADAAKEAGIETSAFPCKTRMYFRDGKVEASCGYGAPSKEL